MIPQEWMDGIRSGSVHALIAVGLQLLGLIIFGNAIAGGLAGVFLFIGREHAQAEYRWMKLNKVGHRDRMPWYAGFLPEAWYEDAICDLLIPVIACVLVAVLYWRWFQ